MPLTRDQKKHAAELLNLLDLLKRHVDKHIRPPFNLGFEEVAQWHQRVSQAEEYLLGAQNVAHELCAEPRDLLDFLVDIESFADVHALAPELLQEVEESPEAEQGEASEDAQEDDADVGADAVEQADDDIADAELVTTDPDAEAAPDDSQNEGEESAQNSDQESAQEGAAESVEGAGEDAEADDDAESDPQERFEQMRSELMPALTDAMQRLVEWVREEKDEHFRS